MTVNEGIQVECVETCLVCGTKGELLYPEMKDKLFGVAGIWSHLRCPVDGHIWLSPRPTVEDITKSYTTYYTHDQEGDRQSLLASLKSMVEGALLNAEFGYESIPSGKGSGLLGRIVSLLPMAKEIAGSRVMWLNAYPNGRLLDVGCGNGNFLAVMKKLGWNVSGVEPDINAAMIASAHSLAPPIFIGTLEEASFIDNSFDAITAHHVIEHTHDPISFLREAYRILKPGGRLVITTPNIESLGHRVFKRDWRGLEVPRHLQLFSPTTLRVCSDKIGYEIDTLRTTARSTWEIWYTSRLIKRDGLILGGFPSNLEQCLRIESLIVQWLQHSILLFYDYIGEAILFIGKKQIAS